MRKGQRERTLPRVPSTFVGRDREGARLRPLLGDEALLVAHGLPGVGKTALLLKLVDDLRANDRWADAPAVRVVLSAGQSVDDLRGQLAASLHVDPAAELGQLAAAIDRGPFIVLVDDLHHLGDGEASAFLGSLARWLRVGRILVGARRRLPIPPEVPGAVWIAVEPLDPDTATALATTLAERRGLGPTEIERAVAVAFGMPDLLGAAISSRDDPRPSGELAAALADLPEADQRALLIAYHVGDPVDRALLAEVAGGAAVDLLVAQSMVRVCGARVMAVPAAGAVMAAIAAPATDRAAASAAADIHERRYRDDPSRSAEVIAAVRARRRAGDAGPAWRLLAESFEAGPGLGRSRDLLAELDAMVRATPSTRGEADLIRARVFLRRGDPRRAAEILARTPADRSTASWWILCGRLALLEARLDDAGAQLERALAAAIDDQDRVAATIYLADLSSMRGDGAGARDRLTEIRRLHPEMTAADRLHWEMSRALSYFAEERIEDAFPHQVDQDLLARGGGDDVGVALLAGGLLCCVATDDVAAARALIGQLDQLGGDAQAPALFSLLRGIVAGAGGDLREARDQLDGAIARMEADRARLLLPVAREHLGLALIGLGDLERAGEELARGEAEARAAGMRLLVERLRTARAGGLLAAGHLQAAIDSLQSVLSNAAVGPQTKRAAVCLLARAHAADGDVRTARRMLQVIAVSGSSAAEQAARSLAAAEVELFGGQPAVAIESGRAALAHYESCGRGDRAARAALAVAAGHLGRADEPDLMLAASQLERVEIAGETGGYRLLVGAAALARAALALERGRDDAAGEVIASALEMLPDGPSLERLCLRAAGGSDGQIPAGARGLLRLVGIDRDGVAEILDRDGRRLATPSELAREMATRDLVVDLRSYTVRGRQAGVHRARPTACRLLERLLRAGDAGVDAATLFCDVWQVERFEAGSHRNTLHVTLNRLRRAVAEVLPDRTVVETLAGGWRVSPEIDLCAIRVPHGPGRQSEDNATRSAVKSK